MQTDTISPSDIRYNAATQQYEARVTLHGASETRSYACSVPADLSMTLDEAAIALQNAARTRHISAPGMFSAQQTLTPPGPRTATRADWRKALLNSLPKLRARRAA